MKYAESVYNAQVSGLPVGMGRAALRGKASDRALSTTVDNTHLRCIHSYIYIGQSVFGGRI